MPMRCLLLALAVIPGCEQKEDGAAERPGAASENTAASVELRILCGSSMAEPIGALATAFRNSRSVEAVVDLGGSETLLPRVLAGERADVFVCHDPFEEKVKEGGRLHASVVVGEMRPVIMVRKGNPKGILAIGDMARAGVRLGIGRPPESTCGRMFVDMLKRRGLHERVMPQVIVQARTHVELANGLAQDALDAIVVWNFISVMYEDKLELVPDHEKYDPVRVTVLGLANAPNPKLRDAFLDLCRSKQTRELFAKYGYSAAGTPAAE